MAELQMKKNDHAPRKSLGQHWLDDPSILDSIITFSGVDSESCVLEIGPGPGGLTRQLCPRVQQVIAVELDPHWAATLSRTVQARNLKVEMIDALDVDTNDLPEQYHVVANIPYYITSKIIQHYSESPNPPLSMTLLIQKEVAERLAAGAGDMSILGIAAQLDHKVSLGPIIEAKYFTPPPKVNSQIVRLERHDKHADIDRKLFFRLVRAGFSEKRKKLRSSLSGGLGLPKPEIELLLDSVAISPDARAEVLVVEDWLRLLDVFQRENVA